MRTLLALITGASFLLIGGCTAGVSDDIGRAAYNVCCGTGCCCTSLGTGAAIGLGDRNPSNDCEECDPAVSQTSWTPISGCTSDAGGMMGTDAGTTDGGGGGCGVSVSGTTPPGAIAILGLLTLFIRRRPRRP